MLRSGDLDGEEAWKPSRDPAGISVEVDRQYPHRMGTDTEIRMPRTMDGSCLKACRSAAKQHRVSLGAQQKIFDGTYLVRRSCDCWKRQGDGGRVAQAGHR